MSMLNGIELLNTLTDQEKANLELFCQEKMVPAGEFLFKEGEEATAMYILKSGSFTVTRYADGVEKIIGQVSAEEVLGEMALFGESGKRMASAQASEDSVLVTILNFSVKELTSKSPELLEKIKSIIETRNIQNKMN